MKSRFLLFFLIALLVLAMSCGGGSSSTTTRTNTNTPATASVTQITIGDGPGDRVASLSIIINAVTLTSDAGASVPLVSSPVTIEISRLAGTTTPLGTVTIPAGQYLKAAVTLGGATVTVVDPNTGTTVQKTFPAPASPFTINLNPPFVSDGAARVINVDMDLHSSIAIDSTTGAINFNPVFLATHAKMTGPAAGGPPNPFTGGVGHTLGKITAVNGTSFTITTAVGQRSLTFATNGSTVFKNVSGATSLQTGMLVMVAGQAQSDGSLMAVGVAVLSSGMTNVTGATGLVASTTGTPVTQFTLLAHGIVGPTPLVGMSVVPQAGITVNVTSGTTFRVDSDDVDMTGLALAFDGSTLSPAQAVEVDTASTLTSISGSTMMGSLPILGTLNASTVELEEQPLVGTVSNLTSNSFTLTVATDGVFAVLAKTTTLTVFKQSKTQLADGLTLANGQKVVVRGLVFNNGGYKMVATRIGVGPTN